MKRIDGTIFYSIKETAIIVNRDYKTVLRWFKVSQKLRKEGREGLLPIPTVIGRGHYLAETDVKVLKEKARAFRRGYFKEFANKRTTYQKLKEENEWLRLQIIEMERQGN